MAECTATATAATCTTMGRFLPSRSREKKVLCIEAMSTRHVRRSTVCLDKRVAEGSPNRFRHGFPLSVGPSLADNSTGTEAVLVKVGLEHDYRLP